MQLDWVLFAIEALWVLALSLWIVLEKRPPASTLAWIFGLAFLPLVGIWVYFLVGPRRMKRRRQRYNEALADFGAAIPAIYSESVAPPDVMRQIRLAAGAGEAPLLFATELELYYEGVPAFAAIAEAIDGAEHHVHFENYIWEPDRLGRDLRDRLTARARAGVEVRLLVDAVGSPRVDREFFAPLIAAGGDFATFNPPLVPLKRLRRLNFRTHRKIVVVDGRTGFCGGMNVWDVHTVGAPGEAPWRDTQIRLAGPAVAGLQAVFLENWHFTRRSSPRGEAYFPKLTGDPRAWVQVVASGPDRTFYPIHELLVSAISAADERVWIVCPYVIPDEALLVALGTAAHRGVDVRILMPRRGDSRLVTAAMRSYFDELLASGVRLYEYLPGMHHGKTLVVDDELAVIGTANFDNRSFRLNFEVAVAVHGSATAAALAEAFEHDLASAAPVATNRRSQLGGGARLAEAGARLFSPLL